MAEQFRWYSCRVRLSGSLLHEVPKKAISAPEAIMLQTLHGEDALVDIRNLPLAQRPGIPKHICEEYGYSPKDEWDDRAMREYLRHSYGTFQDGRDKVNTILGNPLQPLPRKLALPKQEKPKKQDEDLDKIKADLSEKIREEVRAELLAEQADASDLMKEALS